jgi:hypothetical protein
MKDNLKSRRNFLKLTALTSIGLSTGVDALAGIFGGVVPPADIIDCAFRLTNYRTLLNLEYYFINVENDGLSICKKLKFKYSQEESYMIVRLPQQHIAEEWLNLDNEDSAAETFMNDPAENAIDLSKTKAAAFYGSKMNGFTAASRISGYSYLVFRIVFRNPKKISKGKGKEKIKLNPVELLNWNADHFKLVVKQNLDQSVFDIQQGIIGNSENHYPFQEANATYNVSDYPKAYNSPITAIEAPWRLIISPKLPDYGEFDFHWSFTHEEAVTPKNLQGTSRSQYEMWMATLQVRKRKSEKDKETYLAHLHPDSVMDVMIIGAPDSNLTDTDIKATYADLMEGVAYRVLPEPEDKIDLMNLYIAYKLFARTDKMTFSPLGLTTRLEIKNTLHNKTSAATSIPNVQLYSWIQDIAFGRDQEVQVTFVLLDKNTSLKMLWIKTTNRRVKMGVAYLDYREYLMPLDLEKDYGQQSGSIKLKQKVQNNVQQIRFTELAPKRVRTVENTPGAAKVPKNATNVRGLKAIRPLNLQKVPLTFGVELTFKDGKKVKTTIEPQLINTTI